MTRRDARGPMWKNRIVGSGEEAPDQLLANPVNWRVHPEAQQNEVEKVLELVGWVQRIIVNKRTGHLVDGHLRVMLAIRREEPSVPVDYIDVSLEEERLILTVLDPLAAMASRDGAILKDLLDDVRADFPDIEIDLDAILKKDRQHVAYDVEAATNVLVECEDSTAQANLIEKLREEGYVCKTTSKR